jgi:hypothetical protein
MEMIGKDFTTFYGSYHWTADNDTCYKATLNTGIPYETGKSTLSKTVPLTRKYLTA